MEHVEPSDEEFERVLTAMRQQGALGELLALLLMVVREGCKFAVAIGWFALVLVATWWLGERLGIENPFLLWIAAPVVGWAAFMIWIKRFERSEAARKDKRLTLTPSTHDTTADRCGQHCPCTR